MAPQVAYELAVLHGAELRRDAALARLRREAAHARSRRATAPVRLRRRAGARDGADRPAAGAGGRPARDAAGAGGRPVTPLHPAAPAAGGVFAPPLRRLTVGLLLVITMVAFEALAVATALPVAARELGGLSLYGWAFTAFLVTDLVGIVYAGDLADRRGPALPFTAGLAVFAAGLLVAGFAPSMPVVVAGRAIQGFGAGGISAAVFVIMGRAYDASLRPRLFAITSTAWIVPAIVGPALSGTVAERAGWRIVFLALPPLVLVVAALVVPALRRLPATEGVSGRTRVRPAVRLATGVGLALAASRAGSPAVAVALVGGGIAIAFPALRALVPAGTLSAARGLPATVATRGALTLTFFGAEAFLPLALTSARGVSAAAAGIALTTGAVAWSAGSWVQERAGHRVARSTFAAAGLGHIAAGVALAGVALLPGVPVALAAAAWALAGLGMGFAYSSVSVVALSHAAAGREGEVSASLQLADVLGSVIGTGLGGAVLAALLASGTAVGTAVLAVDAVIVVAALGGVIVARRIGDPVTAPAAPAVPGTVAA